MVSYKEWGYQLFPGLAFEDLASRTEKLGGKVRVRDLLTELRDKERDRVLEAKYGRSAVENIHAQEAAKLVANEIEPEEGQDDEDPASSRYMDVGEEEEDDETRGGSGVKGGDEKRAKVTMDVISEQVRQRMEINRRLALERLRLKKEEAAVAKAQTNGSTTAEVGMSVEESELVDLMETGGGEGGAEDNFEEDESALAEMVDEEKAKSIVASTGIRAPTAPMSDVGTTVAPPCAAVTPPASLDTNPVTDGAGPIVNSAITNPALEDADTDTILASTVRPEKASTTDTVADETAPVPDIPLQEEPAGGPAGVATPKDAEHHAIASETTTASASSGVPTSELNTDSVESSGGSTERENGAGDAGEIAGRQQGDSAPASGADASCLDTATEYVGEGNTMADQQASFSSPDRCRAVVGEDALSPLGTMFAQTDVPLEGGGGA